MEMKANIFIPVIISISISLAVGSNEAGNPGPAATIQSSPKHPSGVVFTRWGQDDCPTTAERLYSGLVTGTGEKSGGGGGSYLCLPNDGAYTSRKPVTDWRSTDLSGAEYTNTEIFNIKDQKAPCAVCYAEKRSTSLMIPGRRSCPGTWNVEYTGFLMTGKFNRHVYSFECFDENSEAADGVPGGTSTHNPSLYQVRTKCGGGSGISCPPYDMQYGLECVVCTK